MDAARLRIEVGETDFDVCIPTDEYPFGEMRVTLSANRLARGLSDIVLLRAATTNVTTAGLREHLTRHFGTSQAPDAKCEFCKLQGRILAAEGRRRLSEQEQRQRAVPPVTHLREGASGAAIERAQRAAELREAERLRRLPRLQGAGRKSASGDTEGVWF